MATPDETAYLAAPASVKRSLEAIVAAKAHQSFAGYLCVLHEANLRKATINLKPAFKDFFRTFLSVEGAPERKPFVLPFRGAAKEKSLLFNENVAGSYAPSSLRDVSPFRQVVDVNDANRTYSLVEGHAQIAQMKLLGGGRMPVCALAIFLYKDFGFLGDQVSPRNVANLLASDFGHALNASDALGLVASGLFYDDSKNFSVADFEAFAEP